MPIVCSTDCKEGLTSHWRAGKFFCHTARSGVCFFYRRDSRIHVQTSRFYLHVEHRNQYHGYHYVCLIYIFRISLPSNLITRKYIPFASGPGTEIKRRQDVRCRHSTRQVTPTKLSERRTKRHDIDNLPQLIHHDYQEREYFFHVRISKVQCASDIPKSRVETLLFFECISKSRFTPGTSTTLKDLCLG